MAKGRAHPVVFFGLSAKADVRAENIKEKKRRILFTLVIGV